MNTISLEQPLSHEDTSSSPTLAGQLPSTSEELAELATAGSSTPQKAMKRGYQHMQLIEIPTAFYL
jgi:hypothetical protein